MLGLTLHWRMSRSVKYRSINVATLQAGFMASPPIADRETPRRFFHQLRAGREIPIGVAYARRGRGSHHPSLDRYAAALKQRGNGWGRRALRRLIGMKRTYPSGPFIAAIEQALQYGLFDLGRLEALILKQVAGDFFALDAGDDGDA